MDVHGRGIEHGQCLGLPQVGLPQRAYRGSLASIRRVAGNRRRCISGRSFSGATANRTGLCVRQRLAEPSSEDDRGGDSVHRPLHTRTKLNGPRCVVGQLELSANDCAGWRLAGPSAGCVMRALAWPPKSALPYPKHRRKPFRLRVSRVLGAMPCEIIRGFPSGIFGSHTVVFHRPSIPCSAHIDAACFPDGRCRATRQSSQDDAERTYRFVANLASDVGQAFADTVKQAPRDLHLPLRETVQAARFAPALMRVDGANGVGPPVCTHRLRAAAVSGQSRPKARSPPSTALPARSAATLPPPSRPGWQRRVARQQPGSH